MGMENQRSGLLQLLKTSMKKSKMANVVMEWLYEQHILFQIKYGKIDRKKVVFSNFFGKGYGDNPKYITEEILRQDLDWELVWLHNCADQNYPQGIRLVPYGSIEALRELATAKIRVDNVRNAVHPPKKKGQYYLQTWHGGISFKYVEKSAESTLSSEYLAAAQEDGQLCDAIVSACQIQSDDYLENFWLSPKTEILKCGLPRNDILFQKEWVDIRYQEIRNYFGIEQDTKIILYMPTFRDDYSLDGYQLDFEELVLRMEQRFRKKFALVIRLHPNVKNQSNFVFYNDHIFNGTNWPDAQELYMAADYLITDYSSASFDFALLNRPVFLCMLDYEKYKKERGLNEVFEICPFPKAYSNEQLMDIISTFSEEDYLCQVEAFKKKWQPFDEGQAAQIIVDWMKNKMQE